MVEEWNKPIWEETRDFGNGLRTYRCLDISTSLGQSALEYFNPKLGWRRVNNRDVREAMHRYTTENFRNPFLVPAGVDWSETGSDYEV